MDPAFIGTRWRNRPVVIVASGPSLTEQQCAFIVERRAADACRVIVVNNNYQRVPNADVLFAADRPWWKLHAPEIAKVCPNIERWSIEATTRDFGTQIWAAESGNGIAEPKSGTIKRGSSSGFMSVGLAIKWGAKHIILVGIDCKLGSDGKSHWFGDHPKKLLPSPQPLQSWAREFDSLAAPAKALGIRIVNCTIDTAVKLLPRSTLEAELVPEDDGNARPDSDVHQEQQQHQAA